jgi:hypothetical protein
MAYQPSEQDAINNEFITFKKDRVHTFVFIRVSVHFCMHSSHTLFHGKTNLLVDQSMNWKRTTKPLDWERRHDIARVLTDIDR